MANAASSTSTLVNNLKSNSRLNFNHYYINDNDEGSDEDREDEDYEDEDLDYEDEEVEDERLQEDEIEDEQNLNEALMKEEKEHGRVEMEKKVEQDAEEAIRFTQDLDLGTLTWHQLRSLVLPKGQVIINLILATIEDSNDRALLQSLFEKIRNSEPKAKDEVLDKIWKAEVEVFMGKVKVKWKGNKIGKMGTLTNNQKSVAIGNWGLDYDELGKEDFGFMNSSNSFTERQINKCLGKGVGQFVGHHDLHPDLYPVSFTSTGVPAMTTSQIAIAHEFITNLLKWKMERGETVLFATYGAEAGDSIKIGLKDAGLSLKEIKLPFGIIVTVISYKVEHPSSQEHHSLWFKFKHPSFANFDKYTMLERLIEDLLYMLFSALLNVPSLEPNQFAVRHHFPSSFGTDKKEEIRFVTKYAKLQNDTFTILPSTYFDQDPKLRSLYIWLTGYCKREGLAADPEGGIDGSLLELALRKFIEKSQATRLRNNKLKEIIDRGGATQGQQKEWRKVEKIRELARVQYANDKKKDQLYVESLKAEDLDIELAKREKKKAETSKKGAERYQKEKGEFKKLSEPEQEKKKEANRESNRKFLRKLAKAVANYNPPIVANRFLSIELGPIPSDSTTSNLNFHEDHGRLILCDVAFQVIRPSVLDDLRIKSRENVLRDLVYLAKSYATTAGLTTIEKRKSAEEGKKNQVKRRKK